MMKYLWQACPLATMTEELNDLFTEYGAVQSAKVISDRETGKSKGFGFVEFADSTAAQAAIKALDSTEINGRKLVVKEAEDRPKGGGGDERRIWWRWIRRKPRWRWRQQEDTNLIFSTSYR